VNDAVTIVDAPSNKTDPREFSPADLANMSDAELSQLKRFVLEDIAKLKKEIAIFGTNCPPGDSTTP